MRYRKFRIVSIIVIVIIVAACTAVSLLRKYVFEEGREKHHTSVIAAPLTVAARQSGSLKAEPQILAHQTTSSSIKFFHARTSSKAF